VTAALRAAEAVPVEHDDTLTLFVLCCHLSLTPVSQVALTLRAVGGLSTAEIARALLVPEATVAQRISRAKQKIKGSGAPFTADAARLPAVLHVLYLIFTEGSTASSAAALHRVEPAPRRAVRRGDPAGRQSRSRLRTAALSSMAWLLDHHVAWSSDACAGPSRTPGRSR
jgi:predicted RNA polymerase sigma factor